MAGINLHIYPSTFQYESRMLKETKSVADMDMFDRIYIAACLEQGLVEQADIDTKRQVRRLPRTPPFSGGGLIAKGLGFIQWGNNVIKEFRMMPLRCINCHSLSALPVSVALKRISGAKLIYDTHELETETAGSKGIRRILAKAVERLFIPYVDAVITVNASISSWYSKQYGLSKVYTVRNCPYWTDKPIEHSRIFRDLFDIPDDDIVFLYQGVLGEGRGIELILNVFAHAAHQKHVVFLGYGELESIVQEFVRRYPNIHFHAAVSPQSLAKYTAAADVGLCIIENICLSYFLSLPNKLFEYIMQGVPVLASKFPEMERVLTEGQCGWPVEVQQSVLLEQISSIQKVDVESKRARAEQIRKTIGWQNEEIALLQAYRDLGFG